MTPDPWPNLARQHGRKAVMSLTIDNATLDAETERQTAIIFPLIRAELRGDEQTALDYGCGAGRFTRHLDKLVSGRTIGFDPCPELIEARGEQPPNVQFVTGDPARFFAWSERPAFDLAFTAMVLGDPGVGAAATATALAAMLAPDGLLVVIDHMSEVDSAERWWRFRPVAFYRELFSAHGVALREIGRVMQLDHEVTILAGRMDDDIWIARRRLAEIAANPDALLRGDALDARPGEWTAE